MPEYFGILNIDKPSGMTSHDVVARVRRKLGTRKVGHAGTLDPLATGVLVVCVGLATRLSAYAMASRKGYRATVELGKITTTYDAEGAVEQEIDPGHVTTDAVEAVLPQFTGAIQQLPPMYSAVKRDGKKLYDLARAGETVEREPRPVTIYDLTIIAWDLPRFVLDVTCSSGTYIRSLAYDIGQAVGVGAYLADLRRTWSGGFTLDNAVTLEDFMAADDPAAYLLPPDAALSALPALHLSATDVDHISHGRVPQATRPPAEEESIARAYRPDGLFFALLRAEGDHWRPHKVFHRSE